jgi:hypothetical protein
VAYFQVLFRILKESRLAQTSLIHHELEDIYLTKIQGLARESRCFIPVHPAELLILSRNSDALRTGQSEFGSRLGKISLLHIFHTALEPNKPLIQCV